MVTDLQKRYHKVKDGNVFACDIDDTIVMWDVPYDYDGPTVKIKTNGFIEICIPNEYVIEHIKKLKKRNYSIVIWSAGGSDWGESVINSLGLDKYVDVIMPKISDHMDDVRDPKDKIGRWQYIDPMGNVQRESSNGTIQEWKIDKFKTKS
jgi:phosphoglycolate phosphatase-like HAD superfamily hydrolase